jgi:hypothetical protein
LKGLTCSVHAHFRLTAITKQKNEKRCTSDRTITVEKRPPLWYEGYGESASPEGVGLILLVEDDVSIVFSSWGDEVRGYADHA